MSEEETKTTEAEVVEEVAEEVTPVTAPAEEKKEEAGEAVEVPAKFKTLVEAVENMSVLELHELVKLLEKKFGVSAAAVAVAGPAAGADAGEVKDSFTVELTSGGDQKIAVIKVVKAALNLGLKEAKDLVDGAPAVLKDNVKKEEAENLKKEIEAVGGKVEIK